MGTWLAEDTRGRGRLCKGPGVGAFPLSELQEGASVGREGCPGTDFVPGSREAGRLARRHRFDAGERLRLTPVAAWRGDSGHTLKIEPT